MITIHANFWDDVRLQMLNGLTRVGATLDARDRDDVKKVCLAYYTVEQKLIRTRARATHRSKELDARLATLPMEVQAGVQLIETRALAGDPLEEHFSAKARRTGAQPDWLLNDWGIHHLHVRHNRGPELLFVIAAEDDLYLIDLLDHEAMAELELLETVLRNWPELLGAIPGGKGAPPGSPRTTADELDQARRSGITTLVTLSNGRVYGALGGGLTTAGGTSARAVSRMHRLLKKARAWEKLCREHAEPIAKVLGRNEFRLRYDVEADHVIEVESGEPLQFQEPGDV